MMRTGLLPLTLSIALCTSCNNNNAGSPVVRDVSITQATSFNNLFLDSVQLAHFIHSQPQYQPFAKQFIDFYSDRNYGFAWFDSTGLAEQADNFYNLQNTYITDFGDSSLFNAPLHSLYQSFKNGREKRTKSSSTILETELQLTGQFFRYAAKVYKGSDINATELGWFIPRKKIDLTAMLDSAINNKAGKVGIYIPQHIQYKALQAWIQTYTRLEKQQQSDTIPTLKKSLRKGDSSGLVFMVKQRLQLLGDMKEKDSSRLFDTSLVITTKAFQRRMGLTIDGVVGNKMIAELNVPIRQRIRQLLVNLERLRWLPAEKDTNYIVVNIPEYKMHVYDSGRLQFNMNVIVGTAANSTVIFTGRLKYVVFSPYWNVPESIVKTEILPGIKKDPNYLAKQNMEITTPGPVPVIRQNPGPSNSLGLVKFLFPNNYNIYFHDTPNRNLFSQSSRSFSHGCIRISEPKKLAEYLLRSDNDWNSEKIDSVMHQQEEKWVTLKKGIPVFVTYFTAWVDKDGQLHFRKDIYGHDEKMAAKLFSN